MVHYEGWDSDKPVCGIDKAFAGYQACNVIEQATCPRCRYLCLFQGEHYPGYGSAFMLNQAKKQTGALADWQIESLIASGDIVYRDPHPEKDYAKGKPKVMDWDITSHGIDLRLDDLFRFPKEEILISPMNVVTPTDGQVIWGDSVSLPGVTLKPGQVVLAQTKEIVSIPAWCTGYLENRSTWSRYFLFVMSTPIEAGWQGHITLEIVNNGPFTLWVPAHQGICQLQFIAGGLAARSYKDKGGKYQNQVQPTPGFMR